MTMLVAGAADEEPREKIATRAMDVLAIANTATVSHMTRTADIVIPTYTTAGLSVQCAGRQREVEYRRWRSPVCSTEFGRSRPVRSVASEPGIRRDVGTARSGPYIPPRACRAA